MRHLNNLNAIIFVKPHETNDVITSLFTSQELQQTHFYENTQLLLDFYGYIDYNTLFNAEDLIDQYFISLNSGAVGQLILSEEINKKNIGTIKYSNSLLFTSNETLYKYNPITHSVDENYFIFIKSILVKKPIQQVSNPFMIRLLKSIKNNNNRVNYTFNEKPDTVTASDMIIFVHNKNNDVRKAWFVQADKKQQTDKELTEINEEYFQFKTSRGDYIIQGNSHIIKIS